MVGSISRVVLNRPPNSALEIRTKVMLLHDEKTPAIHFFFVYDILAITRHVYIFNILIILLFLSPSLFFSHALSSPCFFSPYVSITLYERGIHVCMCTYIYMHIYI